MKEKNQKLKIPKYISTHPDLDERISRLKTTIVRAKASRHVYTRLSSDNNWNQIKKDVLQLPIRTVIRTKDELSNMGNLFNCYQIDRNFILLRP